MADGSMKSAATGDGLLETPALRAPEPRRLCTDCGVSRMANPKQCGAACQFITPDYPGLEAVVHGRARDPSRPDELHFGPFEQMAQVRLTPPAEGAQWTGVTTALGAALLRDGVVDGVLTVAPDPEDRWRPRPVIVTAADDMAACRGMRMGYAPLLALLEPAAERGLKRIALIGVPCQVYALRALERSLGFERLYVIGTPCSDNTSTENFRTFLSLLTERPEEVTYLEFRPDFRVELRFREGARRFIPFPKLPLQNLPPDFFALTCQSCVDYVNVLADVTVGYMAGDGAQWLIVRNGRGREMVERLGGSLEVRPLISRGRRKGAVSGFIAATERAAGGLPLRRAPAWARGFIGLMMRLTGPRGLEFARARLEMKAAESILHLRRAAPARMKRMIPEHVWRLAEPYGLAARSGERADGSPASADADQR